MWSGVAIGLLAFAGACALERSAALDASTPEDAGPGDSRDGSIGRPDATPEAGSLDAGSLDAGSLDAGSLDAGRADAARLDAGGADAGPRDAGQADAGCAPDACPGGRCGPSGCEVYESCEVLHAMELTFPSGRYLVQPAGAPTAFEVFCEMNARGGGWTLLLKADGAQPTFQYDAALWTNGSLFAPARLDLSPTEAKLQAFEDAPVDELLVVLVTSGTRRAVALEVTRQPLGDAMRGGFQATAAGRSAWNIVPGGLFYDHCNREGLNARGGCCAAVRIGLLTNQENECGSPDMFLGVGGRPYTACSGAYDTAVGTGALCGAPATPLEIRSFGYVFGR